MKLSPSVDYGSEISVQSSNAAQILKIFHIQENKIYGEHKQQV